jgi:hypothetical protein
MAKCPRFPPSCFSRTRSVSPTRTRTRSPSRTRICRDRW